MAFKYRKSINLGGGFRINLSKSGVGYSWGIPGYRITKTANGRVRKTYSIPGTGVSYSEEYCRGSKESPHRNNNIVQDKLIDIDSAEIEEFNSREYQELINRISKILKINRLSNFLLCFILLIAQPVFLAVSLIGIGIKIFIHIYGKIELDYNLDEYMLDKYTKQSEAWLLLNENKKMWQIIQAATVSNQKINAGASRNINRIPISILKKIPFYLKVNIDTLQMKLRKEKLILLPDKIIIIRGVKVGAIDYKDIKIKASSTRFIESSVVPSDAQIIDYTWQYVNKNGTPDKRFNNNRQLPICLYASIYITSTNGLNIELQCSNVEKAKIFSEKVKYC